MKESDLEMMQRFVERREARREQALDERFREAKGDFERIVERERIHPDHAESIREQGRLTYEQK